MPIETSAFDRVFHLLIFVAAAAGIGVAALAALERLTEGSRHVRLRHLIAAAVVLAVLVGAERAYHAFA